MKNKKIVKEIEKSIQRYWPYSTDYLLNSLILNWGKTADEEALKGHQELVDKYK